MGEPGHYPPPDFSSPPPNSFQLYQVPQKPRASSFHPGMWSWQETPSETSWGYSNYHHLGAATSYGSECVWGNYGPNRQYGQSYEQQWHQSGSRGGRAHYGAPGNHWQKRNKKEPEFSHFCDTCDRAFTTTEKYNEHISQHVKCSVPDCKFMAHEKLVSIHWKNNHAPGAKRIKLDTPEEIAKWREERRKNYPTHDNVEKKKTLMAMREETGGVLETAQFGQMRGRSRGRGGGRGRGRGWGNRGFRGCYQKDGGHFSHSPDKSQTTKLTRDGDPLGALAGGDHDSDRDDTATKSKTENVVVAPKQMSSALGSLMANYGSMSESEEETESTPIQTAKELIQENQAILSTMPAKSHDSGPIYTNAESHGRPFNRGGRRGRGRRGGRGRRWETPQQRRPTLLEMLLAPDVRHERNVLLQCVRYVVRSNFFGLDDKRQEKNIEAVSVTNREHTDEVMDKCKSPFVVDGERVFAENGCDPIEKTAENAGDIGCKQVKSTAQECMLQDSTQVLTREHPTCISVNGAPKPQTIVIEVVQNTKSGCGQVMTTEQCMLHENTRLLQDSTQVSESDQDSFAQSNSLSVDTVESCAVKSSMEVSHNSENSSDKGCRQEMSTNLEQCMSQDSGQVLTGDQVCSDQSDIPVATIQSSTVDMDVSQDTVCGQETTDVDRCMLHKDTLVQESTPFLSSCPTVANGDNCAAQSFTGVVQDSQNTDEGPECRENESTYHIYDDEIWESHL